MAGDTILLEQVIGVAMYVLTEQSNGVRLTVLAVEVGNFVEFALRAGLSQPEWRAAEVAIMGGSPPNNVNVVFREPLNKVQAVVDAWQKEVRSRNQNV